MRPDSRKGCGPLLRLRRKRKDYGHLDSASQSVQMLHARQSCGIYWVRSHEQILYAQTLAADVESFFFCKPCHLLKACAYAQGANFKSSQRKLVPSEVIEGFEIGDQRADVTQGLAFAELNGLVYVDSAGQQATSGVATELCGVA